MSDETKTKEEIYDEQINPLMAQILTICKEHKIPFACAFEYAPERIVASVCTGIGRCDHIDKIISLVVMDRSGKAVPLNKAAEDWLRDGPKEA